MNMMKTRVSGGRLVGRDAATSVDAGDLNLAEGSEVLVGMRPHDLLAGAAADGSGFEVNGEVTAVEPLGVETLVHLAVPGGSLIAVAPGRAIPPVGQNLSAHASAASLHFFDATTEKALRRQRP
jgi:multiple sugar transport system ATP-binding protein